MVLLHLSRSRHNMAHSIARATLGLTQTNKIDPPKISFSAKKIDSSPLPAEIYCSLGEAIALAAKSSQASNVSITLASTKVIQIELKPSTASAIATRAVLGIFDDNIFKSESKLGTLKSVDIISLSSGPMIEH